MAVKSALLVAEPSYTPTLQHLEFVAKISYKKLHPQGDGVIGHGEWGTCTALRLRSGTAKSLAQPLVEKYRAWERSYLFGLCPMPQGLGRLSSSFKVVKFGTKIGYFNLQKTQNLSRGFKMAALKQRIFVCHLERARYSGLAFQGDS